jgi:hypothetical protein
MITPQDSMQEAPRLNREISAACASVLSGVMVAATLASLASTFLANFLAYWVPHAVVLLLLFWPLRARSATVAGVAVALALYLGAFGSWLLSRRHPESLAWLGYLFSLPGGALAAIGAALWLRGRTTWRAWPVGCFAAGAVLLGIIINQAVVCSTQMYCGGD